MGLINYQSLQASVATLIASTGSIYRLVRPSVSGDQVLANQVYGTFDKQVLDRFSATGGGTISMSKKTILLPVIKNGKVVPQVGDRLSQGANLYRIDSVDTVQPDGVTPILYTADIS
jgi:hypothetical protein